MRLPPSSPAPNPPPRVRVGCCGFAGAQAAYFREFSVVEVQQTFYAPPRLATALRWRARAPVDFEFTLKAWQLITHEATSPTYRRLRRPLPGAAAERVGAFRPTAEVWAAWETTRAVARALRATVVVFQCPASFTPTAEHVSNLRQFLARVQQQQQPDGAEGGRFWLAWEPRGDWPPALVQTLCAEWGLLHVVDPWVSPPLTPGPFYFRLHGRGGYRHRYTAAELTWLRAQVRAREAPGWCLFNNLTMREDARRLARLLARSRAEKGKPG